MFTEYIVSFAVSDPVMKTTRNPIDKDILNYLYKNGAIEGEKIALRFRWMLIVFLLVLIATIFARGQIWEGLWSLLPVTAFATYNIYLIYLFRKNKISHSVKYFSVTLDIVALSFHIFNYSRLFSEIAVATTATILLYPVLMFLSVLRYDRRLIIYTIVLTLVCFNLIYVLRYPHIDKALIAEVVSSDPLGHLYKSVYLLILGIFLLHIPKLVGQLIQKQKKITEEKRKSELRLALERQEKKFLAEKLKRESEINQQLKNLNDKIAKQGQTKDKLLSIIGHDLKNPFSVFYSLSKTLLDRYEEYDDTHKKETIELIHTASLSSLNLLENLLNWLKTQSDVIKIIPGKVDVRELISGCSDYILQAAMIKKIEIHNQFQGETILETDLQLLRIVIRNLLDNAIKFSHPNGKIHLCIKDHKEYIEFSIKDEGIGISSSRLAKSFSFLTKPTYGTCKEEGTGLGLQICKEIVHQLGGMLQAESKKGEGSRFYFSLPKKREL